MRALSPSGEPSSSRRATLRPGHGLRGGSRRYIITVRTSLLQTGALALSRTRKGVCFTTLIINKTTTTTTDSSSVANDCLHGGAAAPTGQMHRFLKRHGLLPDEPGGAYLPRLKGAQPPPTAEVLAHGGDGLGPALHPVPRRLRCLVARAAIVAVGVLCSKRARERRCPEGVKGQSGFPAG